MTSAHTSLCFRSEGLPAKYFTSIRAKALAIAEGCWMTTEADANTADNRKRNHSCRKNNTCADRPKQKGNVKRVFNSGTKTNDRERTDHTERQNHVFAHYLDCESHTDVWRELCPTWNQTNEK